MHINLSKHHGLGNDFLVVNIAQADATFRWPELAQRWCDRRFGVGADGLLLLEIKPENRLGMVLYNADGSRAEMSGNGIRCLVQAAHREIAGSTGKPATYTVDTDAGERVVSVESDWVGEELYISVDMGCVSDLIEPGPEPHAITMRVHERGAGITMACGTGACAAAEAAVAWGLVPASTPEVIVHMDGGDAKVRVDSLTRAVTLIGPAVFIASISVHM